MTGTINRTLILGNLGSDPSILLTQDGREIAKLSLATENRYKDRDGNTQTSTDWHRAVIFQNGLVTKVVKPYLKKGSKVCIAGSNRTTEYTDKDGTKRYSTEIVVREITLLGGKSDSLN